MPPGRIKKSHAYQGERRRKMETEKKFKKTMPLQQVFCDAQTDSYQCFQDFPIKEIRTKCLERMKLHGYIDPAWAEACIAVLFNQNDDFAEDVLSVYINASSEKDAERAINFAISLRKTEYPTMIDENTLSKLIAGRLLKDHWAVNIYFKSEQLQKFLLRLLDKLETKDGYQDFDWYCTERALRIIIAAEDFSWLPKIEEIILEYQQGFIAPSKHAPFYKKGMDLAMVKETRRFLLKVQKEHLAKQKSE